MADLFSNDPRGAGPPLVADNDPMPDAAMADPIAQRSDLQTLTETIELMFFAYRDFTGEPDTYLASVGFGRAHHRVIYFVNRHPGLSVADLLSILKITKQSLARVLKHLIDEGYIDQKPGPSDRRQRLLFSTPKGAELAKTLTDLQMRRVSQALSATGPQAAKTVHQFLLSMISEDERGAVADLLKTTSPASLPADGGPASHKDACDDGQGRASR